MEAIIAHSVRKACQCLMWALLCVALGYTPLKHVLAQQTEWLFAPPWALSKWDQWSSGNPGDRIVDVRINPADGKGYLGLHMDTERSGGNESASGSFIVGGWFRPPASGIYEFVFVYEYSGEGKIGYAGIDYRFGAVAGVTAVVGDVGFTTKALWYRSTAGGEAELLAALEATVNAVWSAVSKDWKKALSAAFDVFKAFQSTKETELLQGTERISVLATLDSQTTYPFYTLTTGAVRVKATAGNRARASIGLNVRLVEVQVKRRTTDTGGSTDTIPTSCFHAFWTHGSGVQIENPESVRSVTRLGYCTSVVGKPNFGGWFHFVIPTPVIGTCYSKAAGQEVGFRYRLLRALIYIQTSGPDVRITRVHVWDGNLLRTQYDDLAITGGPLTQAFDVPGKPEVIYGIGISIHVEFGPTGGWVSFIGAGGDFLVSDNCSCK